MRRVHYLLGGAVGLYLIFAGDHACLRGDNWPQWRGPTGSSTSTETGLPTHWSEKENIVWKTPIPEWGTSTPAVFGNAIFLTTETDTALLVVRVDKAAGRIIWKEQVGSGRPNRKGSQKRSAKFHNLHNLASPSPVTDGERVIVHFGNGDLSSYTVDGRQEWKRNLVDDYGPYSIWWGHANSPVLFGDAVISVCMQDSLEGTGREQAPSYVIAHDKRTGKLLWKTPRMPGADAESCVSETTPVFSSVSGRPEMIVMGGNVVDGYDPATGKRLWQVPGLVGGRTVPSPTVADGFVYVTAGLRGPLSAVKLGGHGLLEGPSATAWQYTDSTPDTCCPVASQGRVFTVSDTGIATCLDARTGKRQWRERLGGRGFKASPVAADGHIYFLGRNGGCTVVSATGDFRVIDQNALDEEFTASPAISDGRIYLRGKKTLYAIGK